MGEGRERAPAAHLTVGGGRCWSSLRLQPVTPRPSRPTRRPARTGSVRILRRRLRPARSFRRLPHAPGGRRRPAAPVRAVTTPATVQPRPAKSAPRSSPRQPAERTLPHTDRMALPKLELPPIVVPAFVSSPLRPRSEAELAALALALAALTAGSGPGSFAPGAGADARRRPLCSRSGSRSSSPARRARPVPSCRTP